MTGYYRERGVEILAERDRGGGHRRLGDHGPGRTLEADLVIAGLGIVPATDLAEAAGLPSTTASSSTSSATCGRDDVFAAGDVARFPVAALGRTLRVEHEDHAKSTVGRSARTWRAPTRRTTTCRSSTPTSSTSATRRSARSIRGSRPCSWQEANRKGIVAYVDDAQRPRGFLFWNVWDHVEHGRELIVAGEPVEEGVLV